MVIQFVSILAIGYSVPLADATAFSLFCSWKNYSDWFLCWMQVTKKRRIHQYQLWKMYRAASITGWLLRYNTWACQISAGDYFVLLSSRPRMRDTYPPIPDVIILYTVWCTRAIHVLYRSKIFFELWRISYKIFPLCVCVYIWIYFIRNPP